MLDILSVAPQLHELKCITSKGKKVKIIESVATKWKDFGALLNFDPTGNRLNIIAETERERPEKCCQSMFQYWLEGHGVPATWRKLIHILEGCRLEVLAAEVKEALLQNSIGKVNIVTFLLFPSYFLNICKNLPCVTIHFSCMVYFCPCLETPHTNPYSCNPYCPCAPRVNKILKP